MNRAATSTLLSVSPFQFSAVGARRRAVVVSPDFFDRAIEALEDMEDIRAAAAARREGGEMTLKELKAEFGLD